MNSSRPCSGQEAKFKISDSIPFPTSIISRALLTTDLLIYEVDIIESLLYTKQSTWDTKMEKKKKATQLKELKLPMEWQISKHVIIILVE